MMVFKNLFQFFNLMSIFSGTPSSKYTYKDLVNES